MPKPMLKRPEVQTQFGSVLSATHKQENQKQTQAIDKMKLDRLLRQPRSKQYMDAMRKLDAGGHVHNQHKVNDILNAIREEFPEVEISGVLLGCVSQCYLGRPYEVHTLDLSNQIIEHYESRHPLPGSMEKARSIAIRGGYEFIEVYVDCCRAISANGSVSVIVC